jgi:hypothetical protein
MMMVALLQMRCSSDSFNKASDYDAVVTIEDKPYDYSKNRTYAVTENVACLPESAASPSELENIATWRETVLAAVRKEMNAAGYTEVEGSWKDADVVVSAAFIAVAGDWTVYSFYPWWGGDGSYYYPEYGNATAGIEFSVGSLFLIMVDPDKKVSVEQDADTASPSDAGADADAGAISGDDVYQAVWGAVLYGLMDYISEDKVNGGIERAFAQSPYLNVGGAK